MDNEIKQGAKLTTGWKNSSLWEKLLENRERAMIDRLPIRWVGHEAGSANKHLILLPRLRFAYDLKNYIQPAAYNLQPAPKVQTCFKCAVRLCYGNLQEHPKLCSACDQVTVLQLCPSRCSFIYITRAGPCSHARTFL
jgi:hypothetical protein